MISDEIEQFVTKDPERLRSLRRQYSQDGPSALRAGKMRCSSAVLEKWMPFYAWKKGHSDQDEKLVHGNTPDVSLLRRGIAQSKIVMMKDSVAPVEMQQPKDEWFQLTTPFSKSHRSFALKQ